MLLRHGNIEIETLRRYGRVPPGTRAQGVLTLSRTDSPHLGYCLKVRICVGADPRPIEVEMHFGWEKSEEEPRTWWQTFRGVSTKVQASDLFDGALKKATLFVEGESTSQGYQRFRVTSAEWHNGKQRTEEPGE